MIIKNELQELLHSTETYRVERTISTGDMDKFQEAICAFSNDLPNSKKNGYLIIGAHDDGTLSGLKVDDALMKKVAAIRSDGNILPLPIMSVERFEFPDGDLLVAEVSPSLLPPVRYRGRTFVRIGPRRDIATEAEERILLERRTSYMATFDAMPCLGATINDIDVNYIKQDYLPQVIDAEVLASDKRDIKEQMASIHLYDLTHDCPTNAAIILFGNNPRHFLPGFYIQYVRFAGKAIGGQVLNEKRFQGPLYRLLPELELFVSNAIITQRPVAISLFREKAVINYPNNALRELLMNACMHRDYQSNMPVRLYQFDDHIEIMNAGGLYGEARPENFPTVNDYRNPIIAEAMKEMKYVNMFNQGIRRVQEMLRDNNNEEAVFDVSKLTVFEVNVFSTVDDVTQGGTQDVTQGVTQDVTQGGTQDDTQGGTQDDTQGGTQDGNLDAWIETQIRNNPKITTDELAKLSGFTSRTIKRHIIKLTHIKYVGSGYSGHWEIEK
jgi:ATP-dependent DNA helicase RecG